MNEAGERTVEIEKQRGKMGKKSDPMKALVAISDNGDCSILLRVWPPAESPEDPWGCEFEAVGSSRLDDLGLRAPKKAGFWVWEGSIFYPGPNSEGICDDGPEWQGHWHRAQPEEMLSFLESTNKD